MILSVGEKNSSTWQKMLENYQARLKVLRERNDQTMPEEERNKLLGRIAEVKELLSYNADPVEHL